MPDKGTLAFALLVGILPMAVILSGSPLINNLALLGVYPGEQITTTFMTTQATAVAYSTGTTLIATTEVAIVNVPTTIINTQVLVTTQGGILTTQTQSVTQTQILTTQTSSTAMVTGQTTYSSSTTITAQTTVSTFVPTGTWSCPLGYVCAGYVLGVYTVCPVGQIFRADAGVGYGGCVNYGSTGSGGSGLANPPGGSGGILGGTSRDVGCVAGCLTLIPGMLSLTPQVFTDFNGNQVLISGQAQAIIFVFFPMIALLAIVSILRKRR